MPDANTALTQIRWTRSDPPGKAADSEKRRETYCAALQQFEELLRAAEAAGHASRPLPLFYALSQAGRAVVAAYGESPTCVGHGLAEVRPSDGGERALLHRRVKRRSTSNDIFGAVARASNSGDFDGEIELGAAWVANPHSPRLPLELWQSDWRLALLVVDEDIPAPRGVDLHEKAKILRVLPFADPMEATADHGVDFGPERYPTIDDQAGARAMERNVGGTRTWDGLVVYRTDLSSIDQIAPRSVFGDSRYLVPRLPAQRKMLSPFLLWWVLLYGFSVYARYEPELWVRTLDVDRSSAAVGIEHIMTSALTWIPQLVQEMLLGKFYPIPESLRLT